MTTNIQYNLLSVLMHGQNYSSKYYIHVPVTYTSTNILRATRFRFDRITHGGHSIHVISCSGALEGETLIHYTLSISNVVKWGGAIAYSG